jgi:hypothetical protein
MLNKRKPMQESFSNAAGRHLQDAEILLKNERFDNALYLAGLTTICSPDNTNNFGVIDYLLEKNIQKNKWKLYLDEINDQSLVGNDGESL